MKTKLLLDKSSVCGAYLHIKDEEFGEDVEWEGKPWHLPSLDYIKDTFEDSFNNLMEDLECPRDDCRTLIVVQDPVGSCKSRKEFIPTYKEKERTAPPAFYRLREVFFDWCRTWFKERGAIVATPKGSQEADDLINQLAIRLPDTLIITRDKDLLACPCDCLLIGRDGYSLNPTKFPVPDKYIHLYRTLVTGDNSDNVGSCKGFGPAKWDAMIEYFGDEAMYELDSYLRNETLVSELKPFVSEFKHFQLLIDQAQDLYNVYKCLNFLEVPSCEIKWEGGLLHGTSTLVTADNFDSVFSEIKETEFDYSVIDFETTVDEESREWSKKSGVMVDVISSTITGMGLGVGSDNYYFCTDHKDTNNITFEQLESILSFIQSEDKPVIAHNFSFENTVTYNTYGYMIKNAIDTMLMSSYVAENEKTGLKGLSKRWLDFDQPTYEETIGDKQSMDELTGEEVVGYGLADIYSTSALYNLFTVIMQYEKTLDAFYKVECDALYYTTACFIHGIDFDEEWYDRLVKENNEKKEETWKVINDFLIKYNWEGTTFVPLKGFNAATLKKIYLAKHGTPLKCTAVKKALKEIEDQELVKLFEEKDIDKLNEHYKKFWMPKVELNLRSPKQLTYLFYEILGLPVRILNKPTTNMVKEGRPGNPSTDVSAIKHAMKMDSELGYNEFLESFLDYKSCLTKQSLFFDKYPSFVHPKTGRIHASLRQSSTTTRRFSASSPNFQQISKSAGVEIRNMLKAKDGYTFVALDFSGQELRIAADDSRDEAFLSCFIGDNKRDPHSLTGLSIANNSGENLTYEEFERLRHEGDTNIKNFRTLGKRTGFACAYGAMAPTVAKSLIIEESDAAEYIKAREETFPQLTERVEAYKKECRERKYSVSMLGARRHLDGRNHYGSRDKWILMAADRLAYSYRIQGVGAEINKLAMCNFFNEGLFGLTSIEEGDVIPATSIHDEQVVQVRTSKLDDIMPKLIACMEAPYADMIVPMVTEPEYGTHLGSLEEWENQLTNS